MKEHIHLSGICGVAMGTLACMLKERGWHVTGSDSGVYPPMSDVLRGAKIPVTEGFSSDNLKDADLVIIGNALSRGNPEVEAVLNSGQPYCSMAGAFYRFFLAEKDVIAVAGTHGKTTTTALLGHILTVAGKDPSVLVGGVSLNMGGNYRLGEGRFFIIEADEYDSAFFEKVPKFIFYRPRHLLLTSLEFDHADIYRDLAEIELWFQRLVNIIPSRGEIVYNEGYENLAALASTAQSRVTSYGAGGSDTSAVFSRDSKGSPVIELTDTCAGTLQLPTRLFGNFNLQNVAGAVSMALRLGIAPESISEAVKTFRGVRRRQEVIFATDSIIVYEDFAHHPTAINGMLRALRERWPGARITAVYEPRSATSRRNIFQETLPRAFDTADRVMIKNPALMEKIPEDERMDIAPVIETIQSSGIETGLFFSVEDIIDELVDEIELSGENIIVIMSNGGFDGIYKKLTSRLGELFPGGRVTGS